MQDLRQDLRQHRDYSDGGGSWRGGRGGPPPGGRGGGGGGRGASFDREQYDREKYERVQQMRKESRATRRRRQIQYLDISNTMTAPNVLAAKEAALSAPHSTAAVAALPSSFDQQPHEPRTLMHDAFHTREPFHNTSTAQHPLDAGDLAVALESALETCRGDVSGKKGNRKSQEDYLLRSKIGGKFLARPDQDELVRKSTSSSTARKR